MRREWLFLRLTTHASCCDPKLCQYISLGNVSFNRQQYAAYVYRTTGLILIHFWISFTSHAFSRPSAAATAIMTRRIQSASVVLSITSTLSRPFNNLVSVIFMSLGRTCISVRRNIPGAAYAPIELSAR
jgi:hypothetical protein